MSRKLTAGAALAQYKIVQLLGEGGMGAVYEAHDESLDRLVAIKTLLSDVAQDPESRKRFFREGKAAAKLRHPHVVEVYGVGIEDDVPYLVMELLDGESFAQLLDRERPLPVERTVDTLLPVLSALVVAHHEGVIHRDLKPDNIFLQRTRAKTVVPKLLDFGISKVTGAHNSRITHTSALMGTPYYMSPEQARGAKDVDAGVDQWAMGVILYEALAGVRPITGDTVLEILHRIATMPLVPLDVAAPTVPPALAKVVMRALAREPGERWPSIRELGQALLPFASEASRATWTPAFARPGASERPPPPASRGSATADAVTVAGTARTRLADGEVGPDTEAASPPRPISITGASVGRRTGAGLTRNVEPGPGAATGAIPSLPTNSHGLVAIGVAAVAVAVVGTIVALGGGAPSGAGASVAGASVAGASVAGASAGVSAPATTPERTTPEPTMPERTTPEPEIAPPAPTFEASVTTTPPDARIELDGALVGTGSWSDTLPRDGRTHRVRVSHDGFEAAEVTFADVPPPATIVLARTGGTARPSRPVREPATTGGAATGMTSAATSTPTVGANGAPILE